jgi:hypothetical protein
MGAKVALPSLSLPKQKTHWTVGVVIAAGVLFVILGAAFYLVLQSRQAEADAFAKRESDRLASIKAEKEKVEAEKGEAEATALAAQKKAAAAAATDDSKRDKGRKKSSGHKASGTRVATSKTGSSAGPTTTPAAPAAPPKPQSKASKDIDDLLRSFR